MIVYLVRQTQTVEDYQEKTIYVCSTEEKATMYARKLNKQYGYGAIFNKYYEFVEVKNYDSHHYYDIEKIKVDEPLAPMLT